MNSVDALVLGMLAVADLAVLVHLRRRRWQKVQSERMMRSLVLVVRQENGDLPMPEQRRLPMAS
jgi:hypothetical protein